MLPRVPRRNTLVVLPLAALVSLISLDSARAQPPRPGGAIGRPGGANIGMPGGAIGNPGGAVGRPGGGPVFVETYSCPICKAKLVTKEFGAAAPAPMQHCGKTIVFDAFGSRVQEGGGNPGGFPNIGGNPGFNPGGNPGGNPGTNPFGGAPGGNPVGGNPVGGNPVGGNQPGGGNPNFDPFGSGSGVNKAAVDEAKETARTVTGVTIAMGIGCVVFGLIMLAGAGFGAVQSQRRR